MGSIEVIDSDSIKALKGYGVIIDDFGNGAAWVVRMSNENLQQQYTHWRPSLHSICCADNSRSIHCPASSQSKSSKAQPKMNHGKQKHSGPSTNETQAQQEFSSQHPQKKSPLQSFSAKAHNANLP